MAGLAALIAVTYGVHERGVAAHVSLESSSTEAQLKEARAQISTLSARLDNLARFQQPEVQVLPEGALGHADPGPSRPTSRKAKPDPRWKKFQDALNAQGQELESAKQELKQELASARSDLEGSIAKTHDDLIALQRKGERDYFEFELDKSKNFHPTGPVQISLRKADVRHQFADLKLMVDDRELTKKHLDLYEPAMLYSSDERQRPVELVINGITKNHIHGYISAPKYKASELAAGNTPDTDRRKLEVPR